MKQSLRNETPKHYYNMNDHHNKNKLSKRQIFIENILNDKSNELQNLQLIEMFISFCQKL